LLAYLALGGNGVIVAVWLCAERSPWTSLAGACDTTSLRKILLTLGFSDLHLLLLATASQLFGLEGVFRLELGAPMLGDIALRHDCDVLGMVCSWKFYVC
jgi:hypothetical protein